MKKLVIGLVAMLFVLSGLGNASAFLDSNLSKAKTAMSVGEYDKAIVFLQEVAHKGDIETNFYLGVAYLLHNKYDTKAAEKFKIIACKAGYPDRIAMAYLKKITRCDNAHWRNKYLLSAEEYCSSPNMKKLIAKRLMQMRVPNYKIRAARLIGHKEVYGFTCVRNGSKLEVTSYTDQPVTIIENMRIGLTISFSGTEKPMMRLSNNQFFSPQLNEELTITARMPLILKLKKGGKIDINLI